MSIVRQIKCNICDNTEKEKVMGDGWEGWGVLTGRQGPKGEAEFALCPNHLNAVFEFIGNLMGMNKE